MSFADHQDLNVVRCLWCDGIFYHGSQEYHEHRAKEIAARIMSAEQIAASGRGCAWCGKPSTHIVMAQHDNNSRYWTNHCGSALHGLPGTSVPMYLALPYQIQMEP